MRGLSLLLGIVFSFACTGQSLSSRRLLAADYESDMCWIGISGVQSSHCLWKRHQASIHSAGHGRKRLVRRLVRGYRWDDCLCLHREIQRKVANGYP